MSEKEPNLEKPRLTKESVVTKLLELSSTERAEEIPALLIEWETHEDADIKRLRDEARTRGEVFDEGRANNERGIRQAMIYYRAGFVAEALEALQQSHDDAQSRGDRELMDEINELMYKVEGREIK